VGIIGGNKRELEEVYEELSSLIPMKCLHENVREKEMSGACGTNRGEETSSHNCGWKILKVLTAWKT
jgi:hypothetical protein